MSETDAQGSRARRLVIKIGSSTLTTSESSIDYGYLRKLADQVARVRDAGWQPVIVTSAAIAGGLEALGIQRRPTDMPSLQAAIWGAPLKRLRPALWTSTAQTPALLQL